MTAFAFSSERQKTADRLTRELQAFGGTVTNLLPLANGQNLRFWVSDYDKKELLQRLKDAGYEPIFIGTGFQMCIKTYSMGLVNTFEVALPADQPMPQQDRVIPKDEIGGKKERSREVEETLKYVWGKK